MKRKFFSLLLVTAMFLGTAAMAEPSAIAPELVAGKIMAYVINEDGAKVYRDVFVEGSDLTPVDTVAYGTEIDIRTLGLGYCRLRTDTKDLLYVRTEDLSFSNEAFGDQLAIVFLKRTKNLPLHKTASANSKTLTKVPDGSYVAVLEKGDDFSRVLYGKYDGYLQNAYLSFRSAWTGDIQRGQLRDPNKPKRKTTVNLRSDYSLNGKKVAVVRTLQQVTVLQLMGDWAEIETDKGLHGYLKADWLEITEPLPETEEATEEPAAEAGNAEAAEAIESAEAPEDPEAEAAAADDDDAPAEALAPEWEE